MDPHQRWPGVDIPHDERNKSFDSLPVFGRFFAARARSRQVSFEAQDPKVTPAGGEVCIGYFYDSFECHTLSYDLI